MYHLPRQKVYTGLQALARVHAHLSQVVPRKWLVKQQSRPTCRADVAAMEAQEATRNAGVEFGGTVTPGGREDPVDERQQEHRLGDDEIRRSLRSTESAGAMSKTAGMDDISPSNRPEERQRHIRQRAQFLDTTVDISPALFEVVRDAALLSLDDFAILVTQNITLGMLVNCLTK